MLFPLFTKNQLSSLELNSYSKNLPPSKLLLFLSKFLRSRHIFGSCNIFFFLFYNSFFRNCTHIDHVGAREATEEELVTLATFLKIKPALQSSVLNE